MLISACSGPQSTLDPAGESARLIALLWWGMFSLFTLVLLVLVALWIYAMRRNREALTAQRARQIHNRWIIGGGLVLPLVSVTAILTAGFPVSKRLLHQTVEGEKPLRIEVTGHRWWWEIHYPDAGITTANQIHLPTGVPIEFLITSADVIHSFWIPRLGGKVDAIPGRINDLSLRAFSEGRMRGQCAEFCGTGHAHMILAVDVVAPEAFDQWLQQRQQPVTIAPEHQAAATVFRQHCGSCHTVAGVSDGKGAPNLSDVGARPLPGAKLNQDSPVTVHQWLQSASAQTRSARAIDHSVMAPEHLERIASWLETLGQ